SLVEERLEAVRTGHDRARPDRRGRPLGRSRRRRPGGARLTGRPPRIPDVGASAGLKPALGPLPLRGPGTHVGPADSPVRLCCSSNRITPLPSPSRRWCASGGRRRRPSPPSPGCAAPTPPTRGIGPISEGRARPRPLLHGPRARQGPLRPQPAHRHGDETAASPSTRTEPKRTATRYHLPADRRRLLRLGAPEGQRLKRAMSRWSDVVGPDSHPRSSTVLAQVLTTEERPCLNGWWSSAETQRA